MTYNSTHQRRLGAVGLRALGRLRIGVLNEDVYGLACFELYDGLLLYRPLTIQLISNYTRYVRNIDLPIEELAWPLLRPVINRQLSIDVQLRTASDGQPELVLCTFLDSQLSEELDRPCRGKARGEEVVQLDTRVAQDKLANGFADRLSIYVVVVERAEPAGLTRRCREEILERRQVFVGYAVDGVSSCWAVGVAYIP